MVEFVTKCGNRFPVVERNGNYYAVTDGGGMLWITPSVHGSGYVISAYESPLLGTLRVKAGSSRFGGNGPLRIKIATIRGYIGVLDCLNSGMPIYYNGVKYLVLSAGYDGEGGPWHANVVPWIDADA